MVAALLRGARNDGLARKQVVGDGTWIDGVRGAAQIRFESIPDHGRQRGPIWRATIVGLINPKSETERGRFARGPEGRRRLITMPIGRWRAANCWACPDMGFKRQRPIPKVFGRRDSIQNRPLERRPTMPYHPATRTGQARPWRGYVGSPIVRRNAEILDAEN